jgi:hypothetical protein
MIKLLRNLINQKKQKVKNIPLNGKIYSVYKSEKGPNCLTAEYFFEEEKDPKIYLKEIEHINSENLHKLLES